MNPYISFNGNCEAAFKFYQTKLGASINFSMSYGQSPMAEQTPPELHQRIMHSSLTLDGQVLMAADAMPNCPYEGLKGFALSLNPHTIEEAERLFAALSDGGVVTMPLAQTFWALRFGMVTDQFGVPWMVNCEAPAA